MLKDKQYLLSALISGITVYAFLETVSLNIQVKPRFVLESFSPAIPTQLSCRTCFRRESISELLSGHLDRHVETLDLATRTLFSNTEPLNT